MRKTRKKNQKIIKCRYCQWKNLLIWTKERKRKTEIGGKRRALVGIRCCAIFQQSWTANGQLSCKLPAFPAPERQISGYRLLAPKSHTGSDNFFVGSLDTLCSASFCWSSLLLFGRLCGLDCWSSHGWNGVQRCWCYCQLLWMIFVESTDHLPEMHDYQRRFLGIFFFWVTLLYNQIV